MNSSQSKSALLEAIFAQLKVRYGKLFTANWEGPELAAVKDDWHRCLGPLLDCPDGVRYALENLPLDFPPNAGQFRELCIRKPEPVIERPKLNEPPADPARVAAELAKLAALKAAASRSASAWVDSPPPEADTFEQAAMRERARRTGPASFAAVGGAFKPPRFDVLPVGMQQAVRDGTLIRHAGDYTEEQQNPV